ncbi:PIN domain-like protein [Haematococcus lacustris]|uniref:PIN domain-like protein n=1 Tax=Haematococcus lacustris TaxID=44745 RepID=A0A699ZWG4_HAELA|nr:PIN domain-like protein [Haematococcus lacustris]
MGINKLLKILKPITRDRHLCSYRGKRVAVDAYAWLYMGAYACSTELFRGTYTDKFVSFCMSRIQLMQKHGIEPVVVLDGCDLPMKNDERDERRRRVYQRKNGLVKGGSHA